MSKKNRQNNNTEEAIEKVTEEIVEEVKGVEEETTVEVTPEPLPEIKEEVVVEEKVNTPVKEEKKEEVKPTAEVVNDGMFMVSLGQCNDIRLEDTMNRVSSLGLKTVSKNGELLVGPFKTLHEANKIRNKVLQKGLMGRIIIRK